MGLLEPDRDAAGHRRYGAAHLVRVAAVLTAKEAGLALGDIRDLLDTADPATWRERLAEHADHLRRRLAQTEACPDLVQGALDCTHAELADCPHFRDRVAARAGLPTPFQE
ncbi:MerR family transcriptional regulator [Kitasatospora griseola]|uniref:MerR family transcriptional regulator n=1 Tax=Kitasatospora griseola TaxID=2064 RepID=UPI0037F2B493